MVNSITRELVAASEAMVKTKKIEEKVQYSEILKNLATSLDALAMMADSMFQEEE